MSASDASGLDFFRSLRFLGRVRFTLFLLLGGALIFAAGTIVESRSGRAEAWDQVYGTIWFDLLLALIVVNLIGAVLIRLPIQRHQWSFVLVHLGIVLLLFGAWISRTFGYEGQLYVTEGQQASTLVMDGAEITAAWSGEGEGTSFAIPLFGRVRPRLLSRASDRLPELRITDQVLDGIAHSELRSGDPGDPPAVSLTVTGPRVRASRWLMAGDSKLGRQRLGPLTVELVRGVPEAQEPHASDEALYIEPTDGSEPFRLPLPGSVEQDVELGNGTTARITRFLRHARVIRGEIQEVPSAPPNPAALVELRRGDDKEVHLVFANFPEHATLQQRDGETPLAGRVQLHAHGEDANAGVVIGVLPDGRLRLSPPGAAAIVDLVPGKPAILGDTGLVLVVEQFLPTARREWWVEPAPEGQDNGRPYLRVAGKQGDESRSDWIALGSTLSWRLGGKDLHVSYDRATRPLPFSVHLHDFELEHYPGTTRPAGYASHITLRLDDETQAPSEHVVSMNRPLDAAGFRLFQSSYILGQAGQPDTTILSVSRDPGVPLVYLAFVLTCIGIAWYVARRAPVGEAARKKQGAGLVIEAPTQRAAKPKITPSEGTSSGTETPPMTKKSTERASLSAVLLIAGALTWSPTATNAQSIASAGSLPMEQTRGWAIVADGRTKPLQTFANETALRVTGREGFAGFDSMELLWAYVLAPADARTRPFVRVDSLELKDALALDPGSKRFSVATLLGSAEYRSIVDSGIRAQRSGEEPSRMENDALRLHSTLALLDGLMRGEALTVVPLGGDDGSWSSFPQLARSADPQHQAVVQAYERLTVAYSSEDATTWATAGQELSEGLRELAPADYPSAGALSRELFHEDVNAFGWAWKLYLVGFFVLLFLARPERRWGHSLAMVLLCAGFGFQLLGIGLRWAIAGRAPVSNMYESLVFMGAGAIAFGLIPELFLRKRYLGLTAGMIGFLALAFAENLPIESAISPLVPVLANTYWLSVHVMTIMLSYSAFALAMALGHVLIAVKLFQPTKDERIQTLTGMLDKMLQVGVLFLAAGIACGAVWANESWGRYWGWDPKETWSLITFFVYLAVVHARYAGWLREFGLAVSSIIAFMAVVMTYYGVNFILAAGMHSYGFAEGGRVQAATYVVVELLLLTAAWLRYRSLHSAAASAVA